MSEQSSPKDRGPRTELIVAIIAAVATIATALIGSWDKIFPSHKPSTDSAHHDLRPPENSNDTLTPVRTGQPELEGIYHLQQLSMDGVLMPMQGTMTIERQSEGNYSWRNALGNSSGSASYIGTLRQQNGTWYLETTDGPLDGTWTRGYVVPTQLNVSTNAVDFAYDYGDTHVESEWKR